MIAEILGLVLFDFNSTGNLELILYIINALKFLLDFCNLSSFENTIKKTNVDRESTFSKFVFY